MYRRTLDELDGALASGNDRASRARLDDALARIRLAAQPIVRVSTREVHAYELLIRSDNPVLATAPLLLEAAERQGRLVALGQRVREAAAARAAELAGRARLFVHLHPAELLHPDLGEVADPLLPWAPRVTYQVTERASIDGLPGIDAAVQRLRAAGYQLALDDVGGGCLGLTGIERFTPAVVKLGVALVGGIAGDPARTALVRLLVSRCRPSGIEVAAEGVETRAERDHLVALGCDLLQGGLFARPGPGFPGVPPQAFD